MRFVRRTIGPLLAATALSSLTFLGCSTAPDEPGEPPGSEGRGAEPQPSPGASVLGPDEEGADKRPDWPRSSAESLRKAILQRDQMPPAEFGDPARVENESNAEPLPDGTLAAPPLAASRWQFVGPSKLSFSGRVNGVAYAPSNANIRYLASAT